MTRAKDPEHAETEVRMQKVLVEYQKRTTIDPKHSKSSIRCVAKEFNIPCKTFEGRLKGGVPRNQAQRNTHEPHNSLKKGN